MPMYWCTRLRPPRNACLECADLRGVTAGAELEIAAILMVVLHPARPAIGVDRGLGQDQLPRMRGDCWAMHLDACRLIAARRRPGLTRRHSHDGSSRRLVVWFMYPFLTCYLSRYKRRGTFTRRRCVVA